MVTMAHPQADKRVDGSGTAAPFTANTGAVQGPPHAYALKNAEPEEMSRLHTPLLTPPELTIRAPFERNQPEASRGELASSFPTRKYRPAASAAFTTSVSVCCSAGV